MMTHEPQLTKAMKFGDPEALSDLFEAYADRIVRLAL
jgi:hypothetical protein